jgi:glycine betaine/proline transport system substrate-binding protein
MKRQSTKIALTAALTALLAGTVACQHQAQQTEETTDGGGLPGEGVTVTSGISVLEELFQTEVLNIGLRELGYEVEPPQELEYAPMHTAIGNGDLDYTAVHWEKLHESFYQESGGDEQLERIGELVPNALQGYQIDKATADEYEINNIAQLQEPDNAQLFDADGDGQADLTGCNPGWGCERVIEHHLDVYELRNTVEHNQGQYFALMGDTITRYEQGESILFYTWTPLWVSAVLQPGEDTIWLEVPRTDLPEEQKATAEATTVSVNGQQKNLGFAVDQIGVLTNQEFADNNPAAVKFFELVKIPIADINAQNKLMREGEDTEEDIRRHAQEWVEENQEQFDSWVEQAKEAAAE